MKKILVIDDDHEVHTLVPNIFKHRNYQIKGTLHIGNLEEVLNDFKPDLIMLNDFSGGIEGSVVCNYLKSKEVFESIPIIMVSASDIDDEGPACTPDALIKKPFNADELIKQVDDFLCA
ncbi:hypothetical protein DHW03_03090 [Pedobacter yonginense]|uniref:Response regulatory domain-containing protein n=1 Tax=Pedobacter yonginense TaxID=651869 RepID=A0A317EQ93_9SPHI|nr:response regulator [Pedobacter yonginense]PWS28834.1 hypothetical protein DHW03_03090 [Pedobacter yonginense]